jgi:hypothetical protein
MRGWIWITPVAMAAVLMGCEPDPPPEPAANATTPGTLATPSCQPSPEMPLDGRASPYDSATIRVGDGAAKICYGRPSLRGREMIGGEAVPYGELWRTGANEPTTLHVNVPAQVAGLVVEPGSYSLYTIPQAGLEWTLILNRSTSQWGHESRYTPEVEAQEVGRAQVPVEAMDDRVEQLTIRPADRREGAVLEWQNTRVFIPIEPA